MKKYAWRIGFGLLLVALSTIFYSVHYLWFHDAHHIFIYLMGDIAFVPIEVLLVTLIIHRVLHVRERRTLMHKLNMAIGAFFSEVGTELLRSLVRCDQNADALRERLQLSADWTETNFNSKLRRFRKYTSPLAVTPELLTQLRDELVSKRSFLLGLLENQNLLEHERFTELLWAVFHLTEELAARGAFETIPGSDREHLSGDMHRVYGQLLVQWLAYMRHLKLEYPFLYSFAMRTSPLAVAQSVTVQ